MKEWYLINRPSTTSGGFEDESFNNYREDVLLDILDTELATTVTIYNYDLSESREQKIVIQDNVANTQLGSMQRTILAEVGTLKSGEYVFFEDEYWLINGRPGNNKVYEKAVIVECQHLLKWQLDDGRIIERWANYSSASKYDVGERGNYVLYLKTNNYTVLLPNDEDARTLDGRRVFIDLDDPPRKVFRMTRDDDVLNNHHGHGGILSMIADRDEYNKETDNIELGICDYFAPVLPPDDPGDGSVIVDLHISHKGTNSVIAGGNAKTFSVYALTSDGQEADLRSVKWEVTTLPENDEFIEYEVQPDNSIKIKALYDKYIVGTQFMLTAKVYSLKTSIYVKIGGGI